MLTTLLFLIPESCCRFPNPFPGRNFSRVLLSYRKVSFSTLGCCFHIVYLLNITHLFVQGNGLLDLFVVSLSEHIAATLKMNVSVLIERI